jgi:hypothetical protein
MATMLPRCPARHPYAGAGGEPSRPALAPPGPAPLLMAAPAPGGQPTGEAGRGHGGTIDAGSRHVLPVLLVPGVPGRSGLLARQSARRRCVRVRRGGKTPSRADANKGEAKRGEGFAALQAPPRAGGEGQQMEILRRPRRQAPAAAAPCPAGRPGRFKITANMRRCVTAENSSADRGCPMTPLAHDQDITSWLQLLSAIEQAEAGHGTARLTEICLSGLRRACRCAVPDHPAPGQDSRARGKRARLARWSGDRHGPPATSSPAHLPPTVSRPRRVNRTRQGEHG